MKRKMLKRNENELPYGFSGCSTDFGIVIRAGAEDMTFEDEKVVIQMSTGDCPGAVACLEEDGSITIHNERVFEPKKEAMVRFQKEERTVQKLKKWFFAGFVVLWVLMIPVAFIHEYLMNVFMSLGFICLGFAKIAPMIYQYVQRCRGNETIRKIHRFHSAEHAVINAYYDLKRVPTLEEIKNYSNYSYYCGVVPMVRNAWPYLLLGLCRLVPGGWYFLALLVVFATMVLFNKKMYFFEYFSLLEPTETEYKVAIAALNGALENKRIADEAMNIINMSGDDIPIAHFVIHIG